MTSIYHTCSFTFSVITVFSSFFILIHIQFLDILPLFHILIHMHSHLMFTLFSSLHLITPMCSRSRLSHYSHSFLFSFFIYIFSSALTLLPLCHIIIHMHSHSMPPRCFHHFISLPIRIHIHYSMPSHCFHHFISLLISIHIQCHTTVLIIFYFISSFTFSAVFISSFICIHPQCHHTVFITSFHYSYVFHIQCYTLFLNFIHIFSSAITVSINSFHYSYTFTFSAITLFSSLHFIAHMYSHSVPSHCCHNFLFFIYISAVPSIFIISH